MIETGRKRDDDAVVLAHAVYHGALAEVEQAIPTGIVPLIPEVISPKRKRSLLMGIRADPLALRWYPARMMTAATEEEVMSEQESVDMDVPRAFFAPHPGFMGAAIPIPAPVRKVAEELDGQTMPLREAVARLEAVGIGTVEVVAKYGYIALLVGGNGRAEHLFRVIRYK